MDWRRFSFIIFIIAILFLVVVLVGASKYSPLEIIVSMLATTISVATPLTLGMLGAFSASAPGWSTSASKA